MFSHANCKCLINAVTVQSGKDLSHSSGLSCIASPSSRRHAPRHLLSYSFESYVAGGRLSPRGRPSHDREDHDGARMERIYDIFQRITSLWKELELTKPGSSEYVALLNQIRVLSGEYEALIDAPKQPKQTTIGSRRIGEFVQERSRK